MKQLEVHLHTNSTCNLHCLHCYNNSGGDGILQHHVPSEDSIIDTIAYLCGNYDVEIHLEGGEIFLRPALLKQLDTLPDEYLSRITITTNGTIFHKDETILHTLKKIAALRVSVEGADAAVHARIRNNNVNDVLRNAAQFLAEGIPVWIRMTLNKLNYNHFCNENILKLAERGFKKFQVYEFQSIGRGSEHCAMLSVNDSLSSLLNELCAAVLNGISMKMMFARNRITQILDMQQKLNDAGYRVDLLPAEQGVSIHANGDMYLCAWENQPEKVIGNWYTDHNAKQILENRRLLHQCDHCSAIRIKTP